MKQFKFSQLGTCMTLPWHVEKGGFFVVVVGTCAIGVARGDTAGERRGA